MHNVVSYARAAEAGLHLMRLHVVVTQLRFLEHLLASIVL